MESNLIVNRIGLLTHWDCSEQMWLHLHSNPLGMECIIDRDFKISFYTSVVNTIQATKQNNISSHTHIHSFICHTFDSTLMCHYGPVFIVIRMFRD